MGFRKFLPFVRPVSHNGRDRKNYFVFFRFFLKEREYYFNENAVYTKTTSNTNLKDKTL